ncbi:hypothetical protein [Glaesserella parasuis]|uniref:Phage coat protein n=1 Tax=Glaesserella parasuis TaxID=738 RepID=A0AAJ6ABS5_GLAPU|nr:hypothetical protein [Glaesserella parasuis]MCT8655520.1 hypothetical protein [Glaesserella parasuis]MCT8837282.1 hypothetical protein [Glaesserella parasuis]MDG6309964.1 hypothetical protein [Glaesserella parasuis]MDG6361904.1 hypothetical protein [Glaesserella parasuis]MDG6409987.1 hypothetical protein [Glaesserella parasuis]
MKMKNALSNMYIKAGVIATLAMSSTAFAETSQSTNYLDGLVAKLDVAPIITAIVAVAGSIMGLTVVVYGIRKVFRMLNV